MEHQAAASSFAVERGEEALILEEGEGKSACGGLSCCAKCGLGCCCCVLLLLGALPFIVVWVATRLGIELFLEISDDDLAHLRRTTGPGYDLTNLTYKTKWPECDAWKEPESISKFDGGCHETCFQASLPRDMQTSFEAFPGTLVEYPNREEEGVDTVQLRGWLIPAEGNASVVSTAPRIVFQHGFLSSANIIHSIHIAFRLRQMGFTVLTNNFRNHGDSGLSDKRIYEWGDAYPYDMLGAWDYLKRDPDGLVGGPVAASKVGLMGYSKGGFTALNAFGMETSAPAAWVDSPPFSVKGAFEGGQELVANTIGLGLFVPLLRNRVYATILARARAAGVDLEKNLPERVLPKGPDTKRPLMFTINVDDGLVPKGQVDVALEFLKQYPEKYSVESFFTERTCEGWTHVVGSMLEPDLYLPKLCKFWKSAFGLDASIC